MDCFSKSLLNEKFGIPALNILTRAFAGLYINGKILLGKEHLVCLRKYRKNYELIQSCEIAILHFIEQDNAYICFIDALPFIPFKRPPREKVGQAVMEQVENISHVYLYKY